MRCNQCAFNVSKRECAIFNRKPNGKCWAACYTIDDLENRYKSIMNYSSHIDVHTKAAKELDKFKKRIESEAV